MNQFRRILLAPVVTEKATNMRDRNVYTFKVDGRANKVQISQAVESLFNVSVESVRTVSMPRKPKRHGNVFRVHLELEKGVCHLAGWRLDRLGGELVSGMHRPCR